MKAFVRISQTRDRSHKGGINGDRPDAAAAGAGGGLAATTRLNGADHVSAKARSRERTHH